MHRWPPGVYGFRARRQGRSGKPPSPGAAENVCAIVQNFGHLTLIDKVVNCTGLRHP